MHINITIPRPVLTATLLVTGIAAVLWYQSELSIASVLSPGIDASIVAFDDEDDPSDDRVAMVGPYSQGGDDTPVAMRVSRAEQKVRLARIEQTFLKRKEEILRYQLRVLRTERQKLGEKISDDTEEQFRQSTRMLMTLLRDRSKAEQFLREALNAIWDAEGRTRALSRGRALAGAPKLKWPAEPTEGISAFFHDPDYKKRFGFVHHAIDIPVLQRTEIAAAADGIVADTVDGGLGFSYITIRHDGGYATLYGHVSKFLVRKGQRVSAGDIIALSGGRPGTRGAGFSTGPHLHLMVTIDGAAVDPLDFLPKWEAAKIPVSTVTDEDRENGIYERVP